MKRTTHALPTHRVTVLQTLTVIISLVVVGRLFQVAVLDHPKAVSAAKNQYTTKQTLAAKRGKILLRDLNGGPNYPVALSTTTYSVIADPFLIQQPAEQAAMLSPTLSLSLDELLPKLSDKKKRFVILKKGLTKEEAEKVEELNLRGISLQTVPGRMYPELNLAAQTIGFVDGEGEGRYGIEGFFNSDLKGYAGSVIGEKDAKRRIFAKDKVAQPKDGTDITLTIDRSLQYIVETKLREAIKKYEADSGSVIVLDVKTGAILALANDPTFDLNSYNKVPAEQQEVFLNKAISGTWEPGSIFKTFTLAAGLDKGHFEPETVIEGLPCSLKVNGFEIHNAEEKCYANPTMIQVLADSINLGTMWAADKLGNEVFGQYIADFGFGAKSGIELQPEASGKIPLSEQWRDVNRATISFGQGLTTTPLQMVTAYAAIANGGRLMKPFIVAKRVEPDGREITTQPKEVRQVIKPETAAKATLMLERVVTEGHGKRAAVPGYSVAGKTGTAQVVGQDGRYEENQHIGAFAGFFPSNEPRFAMLVKLDKPKAVEFAESSAAPTFGEIAKWLLHYAKVAPSQPVQ